MSSTTPLKKRKIAEPTDDTAGTTPNDAIDLGYLLAPITRRNLELFVCHLVKSQPALTSQLIALSRQRVSEIELRNVVLNVFAYNYDAQSEITDQLSEHIDTIHAYLTAGDCLNAYTMLVVMSCEVTRWYVSEHKRGEGGEQEDIDNANSIYSTLETQWSKLASTCTVTTGTDTPAADTTADDTAADVYDLNKAKCLTSKQLSEAVTQLQTLSKQLTPIIGPIFSDVIREIKNKMNTAAADTPKPAQ